MKLRLNTGSTYEQNVRPREDVYVLKHGLKIPEDALDYEDFISLMKQSEKEFRKGMMDGFCGAEG